MVLLDPEGWTTPLGDLLGGSHPPDLGFLAIGISYQLAGVCLLGPHVIANNVLEVKGNFKLVSISIQFKVFNFIGRKSAKKACQIMDF